MFGTRPHGRARVRNGTHSTRRPRRGVLGHLTSGRGCVVLSEDDLGPFTETQREVALLASSQHQEVQAHLMTSNPWGPGLRGKGAAHRSIDHTPRPPRRSRTGEPPPSSRKVSDVQHFPKHGEKIFGWVVGGCERERGGEARLRGQARKGDERRGLGRGPHIAHARWRTTTRRCGTPSRRPRSGRTFK